MRAEAERHGRVTVVDDSRAQSKSVADFIIQLEREVPRPRRRDLGMLARIENRAYEVRTAARDAECLLAREAMYRIPARGLVHRYAILAAVESKACARDSTRPRKQDWYSAAMRMLAPRF